MTKKEFFSLPEGTLIVYDIPREESVFMLLVEKIRRKVNNERGYLVSSGDVTLEEIYSSDQKDWGRMRILPKTGA